MLTQLKEIVLDEVGTTIRIGAHTFAQLEEFASARIADMEKATQEERDRAELAIKTFIVQALNNASADVKWTVDRIREEMDRVTFEKLFEAALDHDGLRRPATETDNPPAKA
ncbi:MAG: hypothetical protein ACRD2H_05865 [Terriglobales bacterium]